MDPVTLAALKEIWQLAGIPGVCVFIFFWYVLPRLDKHLDTLHDSLTTQKQRAVTIDDNLKKVETQVGAIHEHIIAPPVRPSWMDKFPKTSSP